MSQQPQSFQLPPPAVAPPALPGGLPPGALQQMSLEQLLGRYNELTQLVATLRSQREILYSQAARMSGGPARADRAALRAQAAGLDAQMTSVNLELAAVRGQLQSRLGSVAGSIQPPVPPPMRQPDPDLMVGALFVFILAVLMPLSIALARRVWRGKPKETPRTDNDSAQRLGRLEQAVDAIAIEVERISEGQRFVTKVLSERPAATMPPMQNGAPQAQPAGAEGASRLALGAGPAEPVRVSERQAVKQSV